MNIESFRELLELHKKFLKNPEYGKRLVLNNDNLDGMDLRAVDLSFANLEGTSFNGCNLAEANCLYSDFTDCVFDGATAVACDFSHAVLHGSSFKRANLKDSGFALAYLQDATLRDADLSEASLYRAILHNTDFRGAVLCETIFIETDILQSKFSFEFPSEKDQGALLKLVADAALQEGSLCMSNWHTCDTVHCIAGWACVLSEGAKALESESSTYLAARVFLGEAPSTHFHDGYFEAREYLNKVKG